MPKGMLHKVTCSDCGREETILIGKGGRYSAGWHYFGKVPVNSMKTSKHLYLWQQDASGKLMHDSKGNPVTKRVPNEGYDPKAKRVLAEMWECESCYKGHGKKAQKRGSKN